MATITQRVATRYRVFIAFSHAEALRVLGFPPGSTPTDQEVQRAYRAKVIEIRKTEGVGTGQEALIDLNRAKDTLTGQFIPKADPDDPYDPRHRNPGSPPARSEPDVDPVDFGFGRDRPKPKPVRISFEEAKAGAGVKEADWKFKTQTSYGGYGDTSSSAFVVYGVDGETHVFVAVQNYQSQNGFTGEDVDTWWMLQEKVNGDFRTVAPRVIRDLYDRFPHTPKKGYGAKVNILPAGTKFTERLDRMMLKPVAFKDAVGLLGLVGEADPWRTNRKLDIRIRIVGGKLGEGDRLQITVNGRDFDLGQDVYQKIEQRGILRAIFGQYYYPDSHKVITKMKNGGKEVLKALASIVTTPTDLKEILEAAGSSEAA